MVPSASSTRHIRPAPVSISGLTYAQLYKSIENKLRSSFLLHYEVNEQVLEVQILQELGDIPEQHPEVFQNFATIEKETVLLSIGRKCVRNNRSRSVNIFRSGFSHSGSSNQLGLSKRTQPHKFRRLSEGDITQRPMKREYSNEMEELGQLTTLHEESDVMMGGFNGSNQSASFNMPSTQGNELDWMPMNRMRSREQTQAELVEARKRFDRTNAAMQRDRSGPSATPMDFMHDHNGP